MLPRLLFLLLSAVSHAQTADAILDNGHIWIAPGKAASAIALRGNRVLRAGTSAELAPLKGPKTRVFDLAGRAALPGFHDAHIHLLKGALSLIQADLNGASSLTQVQERIREYLKARPDEEWVLGRGWDHMLFDAKRYPSHEDLDVLSSTRPIALTNVDGHKLWANAEALRRAHITRRTPDPVNGKIERDSTGEPTGILSESAVDAMQAVTPRPDRARKLAALRILLKSARESGVTTVESIQDPVDFPPEEQLDLLRELERRGELTLRCLVWGRLDSPLSLGKPAPHDLSTEKASYGGLTGFVDGAIGPRSAALLAPYTDAPTSGTPNYTDEELSRLVARAHRLGFAVALHAAGDRAARMALDACASSEKDAFFRKAPLPGFPCRIEPIELVDPHDIARFHALHVAASAQPSGMTYDDETQNYNPDRLGARAARAFAWRSLEKAGAALIFGSDFPMMPLDPRVELFAATTRENFNGKPDGGWNPEQRISLENAISHYTKDPAAVADLLDQGTLEPGNLADIAVFDQDLIKISGLPLLTVNLDMTIFDGKVVYERTLPKR